MQWWNKVKSIFESAQPRLEYFLALIIKDHAIKAVVWEEKGGQASVVDSGVASSETPIDTLADEELISLADQAIGLAEKTLPPNTKSTKSIFGLRETWIEGAAIKEPFITKVKKLSRELGLKPLGFVVIPEAISHLLKLEEGTPPTVLLVALEKDSLSITLVRAGRIEGGKTVPKEGKSDSETTAEILKSFGDIEILPSRILLFDGDVALEEAKQEFISYPWTKEFSFLHFPKIDILPADFDARAIVSGGASEMGFSFEEPVVTAAKDKEDKDKDEVDTTAVKTADVAGKEEAFGFIQERDVLEETLVREDRLEEKEEEQPVKPAPSSLTAPRPTFTLQPLFSFFTGSSTFLKQAMQGSYTRLWLPLSIFAVLLVLALGVFIFVPTATITLIPEKRTLEKNVSIVIDAKAASPDKEKKKIPAVTVETEQQGEKTQEATGKKTTGEKATGQVTIYNKTENTKTFPKGTILVGPNNLRFTLNDDVTVASTAAFALSPTSATAKVTADQIGEESNLSTDTNFPFKDFPTSSYFAKNEAPFTGGTKKEVVAIRKEDQETLLSALSEELRMKAKEDLVQKSDNNEIVDIDMKEEITTKKFNHDVDDEADSLTLTLSITFSTLAYKNSDLLEIIGSEIEHSVPPGFIFQKDMFETNVKNVLTDKAGGTTITIHYNATLTPDLDTSQVRNSIVGKSRSAVDRYLASLPLENYTIAQRIQLPKPFDLLPQRAENITIELKSMQ